MKKNFDNLFPGAWAGQMVNGHTKHAISWEIAEPIRITGYVEMYGLAARDAIEASVRRHNGDPKWCPATKVVYVIQEGTNEYICGFQVGMVWGAILSVEKAPAHWKAGGPVIKDWGSHFLRSDTMLRRDAGYPSGEQEAYSLFRQDEKRIGTFIGSATFALKRAEDLVNSDLEAELPLAVS
jgi:hypothetical protein